MDIGTAKPTPAEQAEVRHHLIDVADPTRSSPSPGSSGPSAPRSPTSRPAAAGPSSSAAPASTSGPRSTTSTSPAGTRRCGPSWRPSPTPRALHARLASARPGRPPRRMEPTNRRRVVRALEVTLGSGRPFSSFGPGLGDHPPSRFALLGVWLPRPVVAERIARRYADQVAAGFVDEVRGLAATGARPHRPPGPRLQGAARPPGRRVHRGRGGRPRRPPHPALRPPPAGLVPPRPPHHLGRRRRRPDGRPPRPPDRDRRARPCLARPDRQFRRVGRTMAARMVGTP